MVFPWSWGAAQAEAVVLSLRNIAVDAVVFRDLSTMFPAVGTHRGQALERPIPPQCIHGMLEFSLELRGVKLVCIVGPPCGPEALTV